MSYGLIGLKQNMEREAMQGLGDLAGQQAQQKAANDQREAAEQQSKNSMIGMGAGIGAAAGGPVGAAIGAGIGLIAGGLF